MLTIILSQPADQVQRRLRHRDRPLLQQLHGPLQRLHPGLRHRLEQHGRRVGRRHQLLQHQLQRLVRHLRGRHPARARQDQLPRRDGLHRHHGRGLLRVDRRRGLGPVRLRERLRQRRVPPGGRLGRVHHHADHHHLRGRHLHDQYVLLTTYFPTIHPPPPKIYLH